MKRSELNTLLRKGQAFFDQHQFRLPVWAAWSPTDWKKLGAPGQEIRSCQLGWDLTDFGSGNFAERGLFLFTVRNGGPGSDKTYAEKIMIVGEGQETPCHFHFQKTEDIINRGGGVLVLQLWNSTPQGELATTEVQVSVDGIRRTLPAGAFVRLTPGESICLETGLYHRFFGEGGTVLVGEVSQVNDDHTDNRFLEPVGRFPQIEEDEAPWRLLVSDYPQWA
ncbi:MAG: D-lyxose/D-mannose family sugar isomerase [Spirochaetales bacterium]